MTTTTRLILPECKAMKMHLIEYAGLGLCCLTEYSFDQKIAPRSYTQPLEVVAQLSNAEEAA